MELRVLLTSVQHAQDLDSSGRYAVDHDVVRMRDDFPGAGDPTRTKHVRMLRGGQHRGLNLSPELARGSGVVLCDEADDVGKVAACRGKPNDRQHVVLLR